MIKVVPASFNPTDSAAYDILLVAEAVISKLADAIAFAERFYTAGSRPRRNNNPGDLERDLTGKGVGWDGPYVIYPTAQEAGMP